MALDSAQLIILDGFFNSIGRKKAWELIKKQLQNFSDGEDADKVEKSQAISEILQIANENKETIQQLTKRINNIQPGQGGYDVSEILNLVNENKTAIEELIERVEVFDSEPISEPEIDQMFL